VANSDQKKNDPIRHLKASPSLTEFDLQDVLEHTFVDATFSKVRSPDPCSKQHILNDYLRII
jgi:hypothetical protein